jgi:hypothetical protein
MLRFYIKPCGVINPVACPIRSKIKMATDKPMRQLSDFNILSDLSPLAMAASADPRLMRTTSNKQSITILNIMKMLEVYMKKRV